MIFERGGRGRHRTVGFAVLLLGTAAGAGAVHAQTLYDRTENVPVTSRPHPEYDAIGIHLGGFTAYPRVSLSGTYDDNIFALPNKTSGAIATVTPSVDFVSNWSRNALDVNLRYERDQYVDQSSESSNEYSLNSTGRLDIDHSSAATFRFNIARQTEPRTAPDSFAALRNPVMYDLITTGASVYREFNRFRVDLDVSNSFYSFFDAPLVGGGVYPESLRDENSTSERIRLSYARSSNVALFIQVAPNQSQFLHSPGSGLTSFDSSGYAVLAGVNGQITHLVTADAGIGYFSQAYDDPTIPTVTGLAYNISLRYFPTPLLTVTGRADHSIAASGIPGTPATSVDSIDLHADYELRRFIIITPGLSFARYQYPGTKRDDNRFGASLNATYLINRGLGVTASYNFIRQDSNGAFGGVSFDDNRLSLTLTLQR